MQVEKQNLLLLSSLFFLNSLVFLLFLITGHYSTYAVLLNILSIIVLWVWVTPFKSGFIIESKKVVDLVLIVFLFLLSFFVYIYKIDVITPGIQGDEVIIAKAGEQVLSSSDFVPFLPVNYGHPTPLLYATGISIQLFGRSIMALRLPYVLFGAMSVTAFYFLLRLFFNKNISFAVSLLMLFSYPLIIVSRLAYEITPSLFFQILTAIFLYLAWKKQNSKYYIGVGLSIGAGLYTYVGFRTFAAVALLICAFLIYKTKCYWQVKLKYSFIVVLTVFIATTPLASFAVAHFNELMARTNALSLFHQNLPSQEVIKEMQGNIFRLSQIFFSFGDPNFKNNPSGVSVFDIKTFILFLIGLCVLLKKRRVLFLLILIFSIVPIINDIFVYEPIPEGHYYGIGHPNTLRIAGLIPIIYFTIACIAFVMGKLNLNISKNRGINIMPLITYGVVLFIIIFNINNYYNQPFSGYVDKYNGTASMRIVKAINNSSVDEVAVSPEFLKDERLTYFTRKDISVQPFRPHTLIDASNEIQSNQMTVSTYDKKLYDLFTAYPQALSSAGLKMQLLNNPVTNQIEALLFIKTQN